MNACVRHAVTDEELTARLTAAAWEAATRDSSDVASACFLTREGRSREIVADLLGAPVSELEVTSSVLEVSFQEAKCDAPVVRTPVSLSVRVATDLSWQLED